MSRLAKVDHLKTQGPQVGYTGGVYVFPRPLRCRFLRAPSIESFMVGFFGKLMDGTVAKKVFFRKFVSHNFFSTSQNEVDFVKICDFLQSVLCWLYFPAERSKNVTNRKQRSSALQKIKIFPNRICIFENTTFLSRRKKKYL